MRCLIDLESLGHWLRTSQGRRSRFSGQIMVVYRLPVDSLIFVVRQGSRGSLQFRITHSRMEYQNKRIGPSFEM